MKRTDLEKLKGLKINNSLKDSAIPERFGKSSTGSKDGAQRRNPLLDGLLGRAAKTATPSPDEGSDNKA